MLDFTAIILAAGRGVRMGPRGEMSPKGLLSFGQRAFVEESVTYLRDRGVKRILIVTGHLADHYEQAVPSWSASPLINLRHNPAYAELGSLHSLMVGLEGVDGPCVVLESDLVYEPRALDALDGSGKRSVLVVSGPTGAGDEVYVWADPIASGKGHRLRDMSKSRSRWQDDHHGELVGITSLTPGAVRRLKSLTPALIAERALADYEDGLVATAREEDIICHRIDDLAWAEVDDERMFSRAAQKVYPAIRASTERSDA